MKRKSILVLIICFLLSILTFSGNATTDNTVYLGGFPAGFSVDSRGAYVNGFSCVITGDGLISPAKDAGVQIGDTILYIDNNEVNNVYDIENNIKTDGLVILTILRDNIEIFINVNPVKDLKGKYKLGLVIREGVNGIGTITFIKGNKFASLGHAIVNDDGNVLNITSGKLFNANITGVVKGQKGKAGELKGNLYKDMQIGIIEKNCDAGVYGKLDKKFDYSKLTKIEIAEPKMGDATIRATVAGENPKEYTISIIKVESKQKETKNLVIKVTDDTLIDIAGGIVQGLSGSPIIQNGKLVGAVTHVFINDPTRGFGIAIENMLNQL